MANLRFDGTSKQFMDKVKALRSDLFTMKYNKEELKEKHKDIFDASVHLFEMVISNKCEMKMLEILIENIIKKTQTKDPKQKKIIDIEHGEIFAKKYLYPTIGAQPKMTLEQKLALIDKVEKENEKDKDKIDKLNSGGMTSSEFKGQKIKIDNFK